VISRKLCKDLQKIINNPKIIMKSFRISNIIAKGNLGYMVNISRIAEQPNAFKDDKSSGVYLRVSKVKCIIVF
jgi:TATA-box binding protein (TBP) (component of TFIID and TFIIIB)